MRSLLRYCVERPLGVLAIYGGLALLGIFAWFSLPRELLPDLRFPQLSIVTLLPNASPEEVENLVTKPVEQIVGTVKHVRRVDSVSKEQVSIVNVQFTWDTDMDAALLWVQEKLGLVQDLLPMEARKPEVTRYNPFDRPVLLLSVTSSLSASDMDHWVERRLRPTLEKVPGVSAVEVTGGVEREIQIDLDAERLAAQSLSLPEVAEALRQRNVSRSAGSAVEGLFEYPVTVTGSFETVKGIEQAIVKTPRNSGGQSGGSLVRLASVGKVTDGFRESTSRARYDGKDTMAVAVFKRSEAYPVAVAKDVRAALKDMDNQLPKDLRIDVIYDQSVYIKEATSDVFGNVLIGGMLAYFVIWMFLKSHKRSIIVGFTIPLALLLTSVVFWQMEMTLNLLTLGGLALGVGMLVDSAVVIIENISRHREMGKTLRESVLDGGEEVGAAVFFSVMTTVAAFAPIPFASVGVAQKIFTPIAVAVVVSQLASLLVGFTFVPALTSLLWENKAAGRLGPAFNTLTLGPRKVFRQWQTALAEQHWMGTVRDWAKRGGEYARQATTVLATQYEQALNFALHRPRPVLAFVAACTVLNGFGLLFIRREAMPDVDQNQFLMKLTLPTGTRLEITDVVLGRVEKVLIEVPEVAHRNTLAGSSAGSAVGALGAHQGQIVVDLGDRIKTPSGSSRNRKRTARQVIRDLSRRLSALDLEGARVDYEIQGADVFSQVFGKAGADLVLEAKGQDLETLKKAVDGLKEEIRKLQGVARVETSLTVPSMQVRYDMDESRLARDGLSVADVAESLLAGVHGTSPTAFRENGKEIPIRVRLREEDRKDVSALSRLVVASPIEPSVAHPVTEYGSLALSPGPSEIRRRDQQRTVLISVFLSGTKVDRVLPKIRPLLASYRARKDVTVDFSGEMEEVRASFRTMITGFIAAVLLVYIVLVAQFNTLWMPLLAMVAVPLAVNGVTPVLFLTGNSLNLMSGQGLMILAGIVVNNSLMLLEFIEQRRQAGAKPAEAAAEASRTRLRPIMMTVIGNIAGLLPLALGIGRGAALQQPMAVTVIFGLLVSTVLTLIVLPAIYIEVGRTMDRKALKHQEI